MLWHVGQANPDDGFEASIAGDLAERIGREIIRRWLRGITPEMYHHQGRHYYWHQLAKLATYQPPADAPSGSPEWHRGQWIARTTQPPPASDTPASADPGDDAIPAAPALTEARVRHG
jgi:hypothetical protein